MSGCDSGVLDDPDSSSCITSSKAGLASNNISLEEETSLYCIFFSMRKVKRRKNTSGRTCAFSALRSSACGQLGHARLRILQRWPYGLGWRRVKQHRIAATFSRKDFAMLESCWVSTHTFMAVWRAENPSLTSSPFPPFTSFVVAQSSGTMRVLVPSENISTTFNQNSTLCCSQMMTNRCESLSSKRRGVFLYRRMLGRRARRN